MNEASLLMIHNAYSIAEGDANALRKMADDLDLVTSQSKKIYLANSNIDEAALTELMDKETFIDPKDALEMGFATSVVAISADHPAQSALKTVFQAVSNDEDKASKPAPDPKVNVDDPSNDDSADEGDEDEPANGDEGDESAVDDDPNGEGNTDSDSDDGSHGDSNADDNEPAGDEPDDGDSGKAKPEDDETDDDEKKKAQEGMRKLFSMLAR